MRISLKAESPCLKEALLIHQRVDWKAEDITEKLRRYYEDISNMLLRSYSILL